MPLANMLDKQFDTGNKA